MSILRCPHCKQEIKATPAETLKAHIRTQIKKYDSIVCRNIKDQHPSDHWQQKLEKWQSWLDVIIELEKLNKGKLKKLKDIAFRKFETTDEWAESDRFRELIKELE